MMICLSIKAKTAATAAKYVKNAVRTDLIELRLDYIKDINANKLERILKSTKRELIITDRKERMDLLIRSIELGADYIDIDIFAGTKKINKLIAAKCKTKTKLIVSYHDFEKTDKKELNTKYSRIKKLKPDIIKMAALANSIEDNIIMFDLIKKAEKECHKIIALCMGEKGEVSRILSPLLGSEITYGSIKHGLESAPGQVPVEVLKNTYRIDKLKNPDIFGLVGNPVKHSKGIYLHNDRFRKLKKNCIYLNFCADDIGKFIIDFRQLISGLSVTIPFKKDIIEYLDKTEETAHITDAVNTVIKKGGKLIGYNTDIAGAVKAIKEKTSIENKKVLLVGAGGAASAIAYGIVKEKGKLTIINRTEKKARYLAGKLGCKAADFSGISNLKDIDIVINGTSVGMWPDIKKTPVPKNVLKKIKGKRCTVFDTVYNPEMTKLLQDAKTLGCELVYGKKMFEYQARLQQDLFSKV